MIAPRFPELSPGWLLAHSCEWIAAEFCNIIEPANYSMICRYIGTMEMLPHMLNQCKNMVVAMSLFISAAVAMALLAAVV